MTTPSIRKRIFLSKETVRWFEETYPSCSLSWICDLLLDEFRKTHTTTPRDLGMIAAEVVKQVTQNE